MNSNSPDHYEKDTEARRGSRQGSVSLNRNITARYVYLLARLPGNEKVAVILTGMHKQNPKPSGRNPACDPLSKRRGFPTRRKPFRPRPTLSESCPCCARPPLIRVYCRAR